jgi:valyl-tRNA synthetase
MPFITEEIYHLLKIQTDDLCIKQFCSTKPWDVDIIIRGSILKNYITTVREFKAANRIKLSEKIEDIGIPYELFPINEDLFELVRKQTNAKDFFILVSSPPQELHKLSGDLRFKTKQEFNESMPLSSSITTTLTTIPFNGYEIPIRINQEIDLVSKKAGLLKDLDYLKGFLVSIEKKLSNERFVQNAKPALIDIERKKQADAKAKINAIEENLADMANKL